MPWINHSKIFRDCVNAFDQRNSKTWNLVMISSELYLFWNHTSPIEKCRNVFFQHRDFFLVIATVKTRHVLKRAWQGLSDNWCTQWLTSLGHAEKVMFSSPAATVLLTVIVMTCCLKVSCWHFDICFLLLKHTCCAGCRLRPIYYLTSSCC